MKSLLLNGTREGPSLLKSRSCTCPLHSQWQRSPSKICRVRPGVSSVAEQEVAQLSPVLHLISSANSHEPHSSHSDSHQQLHHPEQLTPPQVVHRLSQHHSTGTRTLPHKGRQPQQQQQQQRHFPQQSCDKQQALSAVNADSGVEQPQQPALQRQRKQQRKSDPKQKGRNSKQSAALQPLFSPDLQQQLTHLLAAGSTHQADELLQAKITKLRDLKQLHTATDELSKASLLRPAVVVALLVQLGTVLTRQQQRRTKALQQQQRQHHVQLAVQVNRDRQSRRQQHRHDNEQQQRQEAARQQAAAEAAAQAQLQAQRQAFINRFKASSSGQCDVRCGSFRMPTVAAASAAAVVASHHAIPGSSSDTEAAGSHYNSNGSNMFASAGYVVSQQQSPAYPSPGEQISSDKARDSAAAARSSTKPSYSKQQQQQQQQRRWATDGMPKPAKQLLNRLLALVKANIAGYSAAQLSVLQHWLVKLQVSDDRLLYQLQKRAVQQLPSSKPQALVPLLWGIAKMQAGAAAAAAARPAAATGARETPQQSSSSSKVAEGRPPATAVSQQSQGMRQQPSAETVGEQLRMPKQQRQQQQQQQTSVSALHRPQFNSRAQQQQSSRSQQQQQQQQQQQELEVASSNAPTAADPAFVSAWLTASVNNLSSFSASQLAASIYSLALLKQQPPQDWLEAYFAASKAKLQYSSAQDLSNTLWALGTLQLVPPDAGWWGKFQVATTAALWKFKGVGIANLIWGAAKLHLQPNPQLAHLLLWQAQRRFSEMDLRLVASLAWGVAELGLKPQLQWLHYLGRRIRWLQGSLTPGLTASLLLSFSSLGYCPKTWMRRFLSAAHPQLHAFSTQDISNTFTALARMHYVPKDDWLFDFLVEARRVVPQCGSQELLSIANALAVLSTNTEYRVHPDFLAALLARARVCAPNFSTENCVNLARSLVYLKVAPGVGLLSALVETFSQRVSAASPADVAGMLWVLGAFWRGDSECLWLRQHPQLLRQLLTLSQQHLVARVYSPLELKRVLAAVAAMGCNPGMGWLAAHEVAVVSRLSEMYPGTLEQVLRGYRALGYQPQQGQVLQQALIVKQQQAQQQQQQHHTAASDQLDE